MNRFDFTPYRRTMVGFDRLFDLTLQPPSPWPPPFPTPPW